MQNVFMTTSNETFQMRSNFSSAPAASQTCVETVARVILAFSHKKDAIIQI